MSRHSEPQLRLICKDIGCGCMVTMSFDSFKAWSDPVLADLNKADELCEIDNRHYSKEEAVEILKERANARRRKLHA